MFAKILALFRGGEILRVCHFGCISLQPIQLHIKYIHMQVISWHIICKVISITLRSRPQHKIKGNPIKKESYFDYLRGISKTLSQNEIIILWTSNNNNNTKIQACVLFYQYIDTKNILIAESYPLSELLSQHTNTAPLRQCLVAPRILSQELIRR